MAEIVAKFGTFISLLHCGHTNLYDAVFVIDTLPLVVAPLAAVTTKTFALVTEETI